MARRSKSEKYMDKEKELIFSSTVDFEVPVFVKGDGCRVEDTEGRKYLDFTSQICLTNTGFCHPKIVSVLQKMAASLHTCISADYPYCVDIAVDGKKYEISRVALAEKLIKITDTVMPFKKRVSFEVTGATAVNVALKIAKITHLKRCGIDKGVLELFLRDNILAPSLYPAFSGFSFLVFKNAFHGRHGESQCATNSKVNQLWAASSSGYFGRLSFPVSGSNADSIIDEAVNFMTVCPKPVVAFLFEPVQGEGGINFPDKKVFGCLIKFLRERGVYIIADEVQTGFGRTGKMFACEHFGIEPDMIVLSKSLGAGLPIGAVVANAEKFPDLERGMHSGSHHATPLAVAAAIVNIDIIERHLSHAVKFGKYALKKLQGVHNSTVKEIRGLGLMIGIEFFTKEDRDKAVGLARQRGLILAPSGEKVIRLYPSLTVSKDELDEGLDILKTVFQKHD